MCRSSQAPDVYVRLVDELLAVFVDGVACPRLTIPLFNTYVFLMTSGYLDDVISEDHVKSVLRTTWSLISKSGDPVKKMTAGSLICSALRFKGKRGITGVRVGNTMSSSCEKKRYDYEDANAMPLSLLFLFFA